MSEVATRARPSIERARKKASPRVALREPAHRERVAAVTREPAHSKPERTRRRKLTTGDDMFWLPIDEIPDTHKAEVDGNLIVSYEWKRWSVTGQEDPFYLATLREQGAWEPVLPSRHPTWLPAGYTGQHIIKGGLILMERPIELSIEAYHEGRALAKRQVRDAEARLGMTPKGELTRNFPGVEPRITKEYVRPMPIQGED